MASQTRQNEAGDAAKVAHARVQLKLAALAYGSTRHGTDAHLEFTRAGLAMLCAAAVRYTEALTGTEGETPPDRMLGGAVE